jgi:dihydrofolate reductase
MGKLIYAINLTVDGCCEHTKAIGDDEVLDHYTEMTREMGLLAFGRKTYELMVPFWPEIAKNRSGDSKATNDFAQMFDSKDKVVFSRTLQSGDGKTRILRGDLREETLKLKRETAGDILIGGVDVPEQLIALGLVDEYRFMVQRILGGKGRRLLEGVSLPGLLKLRLVESKVLKSGNVALRYGRE